jgi:hypothetical protein
MPERPPLSVTLISLNEEANIARALESVRWADDVVVIDSGSTDRTVAIAESLGARVVRNPWPGYGQQKNFAQAQARHDWVLNLDADEVVSGELAAEIRSALAQASADGTRGFAIPRRTFYLGRWIRHGGWYPNRLVRLADRRHARWSEPSVHEALQVDGTVRPLHEDLLHYSFAGIQDQVLTNLRLSRLGYEELRRRGQRPSLLRLLLKPIGKFLETYLFKQGFRDGMPGLIISANAAHSMFLKQAYLFEEALQGRSVAGRADAARPADAAGRTG